MFQLFFLNIISTDIIPFYMISSAIFVNLGMVFDGMTFCKCTK